MCLVRTRDLKATDPPLPPGWGHMEEANPQVSLSHFLLLWELFSSSYLLSAFTCPAAPYGLLLLFRLPADAKPFCRPLSSIVLSLLHHRDSQWGTLTKHFPHSLSLSPFFTFLSPPLSFSFCCRDHKECRALTLWFLQKTCLSSGGWIYLQLLHSVFSSFSFSFTAKTCQQIQRPANLAWI